jgi:7-keto-8-aminopelargonate synthetase-like enzyme
MSEYSSTEARQDALRAISDNLFMVEIAFEKSAMWLPVIANDSDSAEMAAKKWIKNMEWVSIIAYPTLNAIEETIK